MARRSTLGINNPLDRLGDGPLDFIAPPAALEPVEVEAEPETVPEPELKMLGVRIPVELHHQLKARALTENTTMQELSIRVYQSYLDRQES